MGSQGRRVPPQPITTWETGSHTRHTAAGRSLRSMSIGSGSNSIPVRHGTLLATSSLASDRFSTEDRIMAHPYHHAVRSARLFGGTPGDYVAIHDWFDERKAHIADLRHRALRHHSEGIFLCERIFGATVVNSDGKYVPVRTIGEQHVTDDLGWIPSVKDWLQHIDVQPWMGRTAF